MSVNPAAKIGVKLLSHEMGEITALSLHQGVKGFDMVGHCLIEHRLLR